MADVLDLHQLLKVQQVSVIQAVSLDGLAGLLKQLLQGQKEADDQIQRQKAEIDALKAAQADRQQCAADAGTSGTSAFESDAASQPSLQDQLSAISKRLSDLEATSSAISPAGHSGPSTHELSGSTGTAEGTAGDGAHTAADGPSTSSPAAAAAMPSQTGTDPADLQELTKQQQQLAQQLADVAAAHKGLQQQVAALEDSKADRAAVQDMLLEGLRGKADNAAVNQLKNQFAGKADRSELDALLNAMSTSGSPSANSPDESGADPAAADAVAAYSHGAKANAAPYSGAQAASGYSAGPDLAAGGSRRGTRERESAGDIAQQLSKLQLQVVVLQERVNKKADGQTVADLSEGLASTNSQVSDLAAALQEMQQQLAAAQNGLNGLQDSLSSHAADGAMHAGQHAGNVPPSAAQGPQGELLPALAAKVSALESALPGLQAAVAAAQQPRRVSGEMPASSKLVQALAAQLADLGTQVSHFSAHSPGAGSSQSADALNAAANGGMMPAGTEGAGGEAGYPTAGFGVELAAELDGRLSGLEALVQDLAAMKADQAGMQELRALLADTATQADTDLIRQRLTAQQSLLDHLARQLSTMSSSHSSNRGSRPQSAAGTSAHHSLHGASTPASAEYSFFGGAAGAASGAQGVGGMHSLPAGANWPALRGAADAGTALGGDNEGLQDAMQAQLAAHQDSLEQLAEAISLLATGQAAAVILPAAAGTAAGTGFAGVRGALCALQVESEEGVNLAAGRSDGTGEGSVPETPNLRFQHTPSLQQAEAAGTAGLAGGTGLGTAAGAGRPGTPLGTSFLGSGQSPGGGHFAGSGAAGLGSQRERQAGFLQPSAAAAVAAAAGAGPQVARLKRLLQTGQVGRKMDWFDPALLQKMAQRLAAIDAMLRNGAGGAGSAGSLQPGDLEGRLRRLASDVRHLKDRMAELLGAGGLNQGGLRALGQASDGDHSMLSGKPLGGYRCMACDRPLATLDSRPGPHLPTGQLPVSLLSGAEVAVSAGQALGKLPASTGTRKSTADSPAAHNSDPMLVSSPDGRRAVGPQNWYTSVHGLPAEQLPKGDVGPHLPPGGWRGSQPLRGEDGAPLLPSVHRGSTAEGTGVTPRAV